MQDLSSECTVLTTGPPGEVPPLALALSLCQMQRIMDDSLAIASSESTAVCSHLGGALFISTVQSPHSAQLSALKPLPPWLCLLPRKLNYYNQSSAWHMEKWKK